MSNNSIALTYLGNKVNTSIATCLKYLQDFDGNIISFDTIFTNLCCSRWTDFEYKLSLLTAGGEICFNSGIFEILSSTTLPNNISIYGVGKDATVLQLPSDTTITNVFTGNAVSNITLSDLTIDLNNVSGANGLTFTNSINLTIRNCKIINSLNASMLSVITTSSNLTVDGCVFDTGAGSGNTVVVNSGGMKIVNSKFAELPTMLFQNGTNGIIFSNNNVDNVASFELDAVENVNITCNIIKNYTTPLIVDNGCAACIISDNVFNTNSTTSTISLLDVNNVQFINNLINNNSSELLEVGAAANTVFVKNNNITGTILDPSLSHYNVNNGSTNVCVINNHSKRAVSLNANQLFSNLYDSQLDMTNTNGIVLNITLSPLTSATNEQYVYVTSNGASIGDFDLLGLYDPVGGYTHTVISAADTCVIQWTGLHWRLIDPGNTAPA